ncbi:pH-response regulator [Epithele typhae]|uniref:pH-response regulator n=1 Tax=Epithele typhae TaxID=378194 RepID=UPI002008536D|nr:pH-response regulator [Epithele typhae]KAH9945162.1 pH-response regulator [Epithele typhae]
MPNQLSIPFKRTYVVPIRDAVRDYILAHHTGTHPDAYRWDVSQWEKLRSEVVSSVVHVDRVAALISYHAQIVFILTKLPADIGLEIPYAPVFDGNALPETSNSLIYDRAGVLFNLSALFSQLATAEDRSTPHGLKHAIKFYQNAAGTLQYLADTVSPLLQSSLAPNEAPVELLTPFIRSLEFLMLAQAQECVWQRAVMDNFKNGLIAKLAAKVGSLYGISSEYIKENASARRVVPSSWQAHLETKAFHFQAAAQYRKSLEDLEVNNYGYEVARLLEAHSLAKRGYDIARRGGASAPVQQDIKSLLDILQKNITRAERDNDLIYHKDVPPTSALPAIVEVSVAIPTVELGLKDPKTAVGSDGVIFGELLGWGVRTAIDIYNDRRQNWIAEEVSERVRRLDDNIANTLESLSLPSALDALDKPIGLPPSLVKKAGEVRADSGPERIEAMIRDVQALAKHNADLIDEAMDILDHEADEDEAFREGHPDVERPASHEANTELVQKEQRYRAVLQQARDSDELVRQKWEQWEDNIVQLTWTEASFELEQSIPSSTSADRLGQNSPPSEAHDLTRAHARALRALLERLEDLSRARVELEARVGRLAASDDITQRVLKAASGMEQWVNVQPAMFEDILDAELSKFDRFRVQLDEDEEKQEDMLRQVSERRAEFIQSRRDDASIQARELALQSMDLAYHKYKEIIRNLEEGLKFYNDLAVILSQFRDTCKDWVVLRRREIRHVFHRQPPPPAAAPIIDRGVKRESEEHRSSISDSARRRARAPLDLPPPNSDEWETMDMPKMPSVPKKTPKKKVAVRH